MKKLLSVFVLALLFLCSNCDAPKPQADPTKLDLFNLKDLPSITLEFSLDEWNTLLTNYDLNPKNEKKVVSHFTFALNGTTVELDSIGLKLRGNTSRRRPEGDFGQLHNAANPDWHHCHFALDFSKFKGAQRFEGLNKLNLKWFKDDAAYCREIYCYDLFNRYSCWTAPRASYCKVTIKVEGDTQPGYYGVYAMIESMDEDFIARQQDKWGSGVGFLWKCGYGDSSSANFVTNQGIGVEAVDLNPSLSQYFAYDLKTRKSELVTAQAELVQFISDLNTKTGVAFQTWIEQKMDINLFLRTYATNVILGLWDDYWVNTNNFYFYFATNGKAYFIPYDCDNSLGTSQIMANSGTQNPLIWGNMSQRPLITKILAIPKYKTMYQNYITILANPDNDLFDKNKSINRIQTWHSLISSHVSNDTGEDMSIEDKPASWGNQPNYRLKSGNNSGGSNGPANYFGTRAATIPW